MLASVTLNLLTEYMLSKGPFTEIIKLSLFYIFHMSVL